MGFSADAALFAFVNSGKDVNAAIEMVLGGGVPEEPYAGVAEAVAGPDPSLGGVSVESPAPRSPSADIEPMPTPDATEPVVKPVEITPDCIERAIDGDEELRNAFGRAPPLAAKVNTSPSSTRPDPSEQVTYPVDQLLWDSVKGSDLGAAKRAYDQGACPDLAQVPSDDDKMFVVPFDEHECGNLDGHHCGSELMSGCYGGLCFETTLMMAAKNDDLPMIEWLCAVGCNVSGSIQASFADGYGGGGFTPLFFASSIEAMSLLCARGADVNAHCREDEYETRLVEESVLQSVKHGGVEAALLIQHGANVNDVGGVNGWGEGSLTSYWPRVVCSGDVSRAAKFLEKHKADANWPQSVLLQSDNPDISSITERVWLGRTVLMMAIQKENVAMVELLLKHDADVNLAEFIYPAEIEFDDLDDAGQRYFDSDGVKVIDSKKATPLSVALGTENATIIEMLRARGAVAQDDNARTPWEGFEEELTGVELKCWTVSTHHQLCSKAQRDCVSVVLHVCMRLFTYGTAREDAGAAGGSVVASSSSREPLPTEVWILVLGWLKNMDIGALY
jgi:hypothetical protein